MAPGTPAQNYLDAHGAYTKEAPSISYSENSTGHILLKRSPQDLQLLYFKK